MSLTKHYPEQIECGGYLFNTGALYQTDDYGFVVVQDSKDAKVIVTCMEGAIRTTLEVWPTQIYPLQWAAGKKELNLKDDHLYFCELTGSEHTFRTALLYFRGNWYRYYNKTTEYVEGKIPDMTVVEPLELIKVFDYGR